MLYNFNGKSIKIDDNEIKSFMEKHDLSKEEAINLWLEDNDYLENEELDELDTKAKKVKINHDARAVAPSKASKPRELKVSDEKKEVFKCVYDALVEKYGANVSLEKENKLIFLSIHDKKFKIDLIEQRNRK